MKELILKIEEGKFQAFLEFIKTLDYVSVKDEKEQFLDDLDKSLAEVKKMQEGKLTKKTAKELLDEL